MRSFRALSAAATVAIALAISASASADTLWNQTDKDGSGSYDSEVLPYPYDQGSQEIADDFLAAPPTGQHWHISEVDVHGTTQYGQPNFVRVAFYANKGTLPADTALVEQTNLTPLTGLDTGNFTIALNPPVDLPAGTYWIAVQGIEGGGLWNWTTRTAQNLHMAAIRAGGGHGYTCLSWESLASCFGTITEPDTSFRLIGTVASGTAPTPTPPADTTPPVLSAKAPKTESIKHGFVSVTDTTNEAGTDTATGSVSLSGAGKSSAAKKKRKAKRYKLTPVSVTHGAGKVTLKLKIPTKALKAIRKALAHHRKATATVRVGSQDVAGNSAKTRTLHIKLKR
ncbi:MAG TPA: hypothetical protein VH817_12120 [Thermoleophilaceae bacterium]|jgi:hypothetical protein